jgi:hypothetical protein
MKRIQTQLLALAIVLALNITTQAADVTPAEARAIAKDAYIYGFPLVDNYRIQYGYWKKQPKANGTRLWRSR